MNKRLRLPLALALALGSPSALALGLGQIEVKSALNEPLSAVIPVLSSTPGETEALSVRLAPPEALARVGLPAPTGVAANLQFSVDRNERGEAVIRVSTPGEVVDPFVTFLIEVDWGKGRMLREYTVLLDPPTMAPVRGAPAATVPISELPAAEPEALPDAPPPPELEPADVAAEPPRSQPEPLASESAPEPDVEPETSAPAAAAPSGNYGPVASGETLWSIAQRMRPDTSVSMSQMMLALLYANPDAFIDGNINLLKQGAVLRIPGREEALNVAAADAAAIVREQMAQWSQRTAAVSQPAETRMYDEPLSTPSAPGRTTSDSRLEVVPPRGEPGAGAQSGASVDGQGSELRAELARAREELSTLSQENVDLRSRVGELEKIQGDSQRLIELKDSELAAAQRRVATLEAQLSASTAEPLATDAAAAPPGPEPVAVAPAEDAAALDPDAGAEDATAVEDGGATSLDALPEGAEDAAAATDAPVTAALPDPEPAVAAEVQPPPPPPPAPPLWTNLWVLAGGGAVLAGLVAMLLLRRRRPAAPARSGPSLSSTLAASTQAAATDDSDRESELIEAVAMDPADLTRHLDLVRHYYDLNDAAGFEQAAEAMYARVYDPDDLAWKQVVAMGQEIAPEHPLFVTALDIGAAAPTPAAAREVDWMSPPPAAAPAPAPVPQAPAPAPAPQRAAPDAGTTQQFNLDDLRPKVTQPKVEVPKLDPTPALQSFDFNPPAAPALDTDISIDADAAATKLELARAYLDMGDVEGARGMLEEVVSEGNPGQRAEAKRLLDEIR